MYYNFARRQFLQNKIVTTYRESKKKEKRLFCIESLYTLNLILNTKYLNKN